MYRYFTLISISLVMFAASAIASNGNCPSQDNSFESCFSIDTEPGKRLKDFVAGSNLHRSGFSFWVENKKDQEQLCTINYTTSYAFYDLVNDVDGCKVSEPGLEGKTEPVRGKEIDLPAKEKLEWKHQKTPRFQSAQQDNRNPNVMPLYCGGSMDIYCVDSCNKPGQTPMKKNETRIVRETASNGTSFNNSCSVTEYKEKCVKLGESPTKVPRSTTFFNGWLDIAGKCSKKKGCRHEGRNRDHGWSTSTSEYCRGYLWKTNSTRCENGSIQNNTTYHRSCEDGIPGVEK